MLEAVHAALQSTYPPTGSKCEGNPCTEIHIDTASTQLCPVSVSVTGFGVN